METAESPKVILDIPCRACAERHVTLALLTAYGSYCHCEACGHDWHEERHGENAEETR